MTVIADADIFRAAARIVECTGEEAQVACIALVSRWERRGDTEAARTWGRVLAAVIELATATRH